MSLDSVAVAQPADVGEVGGDGVEFLEPLGDGRHPGLVNEGEGDRVFLEEIGGTFLEPGFVADFKRELAAFGKSFQERAQTREESRQALELFAIEVGELQEHGAELFSEVTTGGGEFVEFLFAIE